MLARITTRRRFFTLSFPSIAIANQRSIHISSSSPKHTSTSFTLYPPRPRARSITMAIPTTKSTAPLVWIDCEMTGLNPQTDTILQICCFITDSNLHPLDPHGFESIISRPQSTLDAMDSWCQTTHTTTGLIHRVLSPTAVSPETASSQLLSYIQKYVPQPRIAHLAGNTVHMDKSFLVKMCPEVIEHLHYRIVDASSIKECVKRWCSQEFLDGMPQKTYTHEAKQDILESIAEMRYYKEMFFEGK